MLLSHRCQGTLIQSGKNRKKPKKNPPKTKQSLEHTVTCIKEPEQRSVKKTLRLFWWLVCWLTLALYLEGVACFLFSREGPRAMGSISLDHPGKIKWRNPFVMYQLLWQTWVCSAHKPPNKTPTKSLLDV